MLNCNSYDVAVHAAMELGADKLCCVTGDDIAALDLPQARRAARVVCACVRVCVCVCVCVCRAC